MNPQFEQENGGMSSYITFGSGLAAELEFYYGAGQTVNLLAYAFSGSNPLLPTPL